MTDEQALYTRFLVVTGTLMKNDKGVVLHLKSATQGIALHPGIEGMQVTMK